MPKQNRKFGVWGEKLAQDFLQKRGYEIVCRNFQKQCGEIDLICQKEGTLHFVEVKTRTSGSVQKFGLPEEAINHFKQRKIIKTACAYLAEYESMKNINWQIDVISITYSPQGQKAKITFIENAFGES